MTTTLPVNFLAYAFKYQDVRSCCPVLRRQLTPRQHRTPIPSSPPTPYLLLRRTPPIHSCPRASWDRVRGARIPSVGPGTTTDAQPERRAPPPLKRQGSCVVSVFLADSFAHLTQHYTNLQGLLISDLFGPAIAYLSKLSDGSSLRQPMDD